MTYITLFKFTVAAAVALAVFLLSGEIKNSYREGDLGMIVYIISIIIASVVGVALILSSL